MSSDQQMRAVVERIGLLVDELGRAPDPTTGARARELLQLMMRLYGAGLTRVLQVIELHDGARGRTLEALLADDLVASLLVLHDLHPESVETRIRRGLARLEEPAGAAITLLDVRDGTARVKVEVERRTAPLLDVRRLIEEIVRAVAPDLGVVEIEGLPASQTPHLVQLGRRQGAEQPDGIPVP